MTALSGAAQRGGAYLLTDGAGMNAEHVIAQIGSKVVDLDAQRMAIGWSGHVMIADLERGIDAAGASQGHIFNALPAIIREIAAANVLVGHADGVPTPPVRLLIALWSDRANEPQLWAIHSDTIIFGPRYVPFTPVRLKACTALEPDAQYAAFGRIPAYDDASDFDVRADGLRLLEAERLQPYPEGHYAVGGLAQLTSVTAKGVVTEVLRWWPDAVGCRIDPFA